jgi:hypothetical protein
MDEDDNDDLTPDVTIDETHPLWRDWDDDDWRGSTASAWMARHIRPGIRVALKPPRSVSEDLYKRVMFAMLNAGASVVVP